MTENQTADLSELAHTLGLHPARLVICNEGSCAVKISPASYRVTAAGVNLSRLAPENSVEFELMKMSALLAAETAGEEELAAARTSPGSTPASSDALLYSYLLSFDGVTMAAHIQPVEINQITCSPRARQFADRRCVPNEIIAFGSAMVLVPYADPGLPLAKEAKRRILLWRDRYKTAPKVILIHNHGMFVLGGSMAELLDTIDSIIKAAQVFIGSSMLGGPVFMTPTNVTQIEPLKEI